MKRTNLRRLRDLLYLASTTLASWYMAMRVTDKAAPQVLIVGISTAVAGYLMDKANEPERDQTQIVDPDARNDHAKRIEAKRTSIQFLPRQLP